MKLDFSGDAFEITALFTSILKHDQNQDEISLSKKRKDKFVIKALMQ